MAVGIFNRLDGRNACGYELREFVFLVGYCVGGGCDGFVFAPCKSLGGIYWS